MVKLCIHGPVFFHYLSHNGRASIGETEEAPHQNIPKPSSLGTSLRDGRSPFISLLSHRWRGDLTGGPLTSQVSTLVIGLKDMREVLFLLLLQLYISPPVNPLNCLRAYLLDWAPQVNKHLSAE